MSELRDALVQWFSNFGCFQSRGDLVFFPQTAGVTSDFFFCRTIEKLGRTLELCYSINSRYLLFFETTITEKTADLVVVQKMIIDTFHKEG